MPGRKPAKYFRAILFDILTASAMFWAADEHIFLLINKSAELILIVNYTIKYELMKVFVESAYKVIKRVKIKSKNISNGCFPGGKQKNAR
jgi:hypothetical protein